VKNSCAVHELTHQHYKKSLANVEAVKECFGQKNFTEGADRCMIMKLDVAGTDM
jgi:hypothetical protein